MPDPFETDMDSGSEVEKLAQELDSRPKPDYEGDPDAPVEVSVDPPPSPDRGDVDEGGDEERGSRRDRRRNRYQEQFDRASAAERERDRLVEENEKIRATMLQQIQASSQPEGKREPDELDQAYSEQERLWEVYNAKLQAGNLSAEDQAGYLRENRRLADRYADLRIRRGVQEGINDYERNRPKPSKLKQELDAVYADVLTNDRARAYMQGRFQSRQALEKVGDDEQGQRALLAEVMDETRKQFQIGQYAGRANDARARSRHTGVGTTQSGGGSGKPRTITMTSGMKMLANEMYPDLPEGERYKKWAQEIGPDYLEEESKR